LIGEHFVDSPFPSIAIDNVQAAADVVAHLIERGGNRIAFLGMPSNSPRFNVLRRAGYLRAVEEAGLTPILEIEVSDFTYLDGHGAGERLIQRIGAGERIDAIFCVTDEVAIGVIRALHDAGLRVPQDVAVAGFDDIIEGRYSSPRLTTAA